MRIEVTYIDTCYPDFLTDHHNREGELLVGIILGSETPIADQLVDELSSGDYGVPDEISDDDIKRACRGIHVDLRPVDRNGDRCPFDSEELHGEEQPSAWFLLKWR